MVKKDLSGSLSVKHPCLSDLVFLEKLCIFSIAYTIVYKNIKLKVQVCLDGKTRYIQWFLWSLVDDILSNPSLKLLPVIVSHINSDHSNVKYQSFVCYTVSLNIQFCNFRFKLQTCLMNFAAYLLLTVSLLSGTRMGLAY